MKWNLRWCCLTCRKLSQERFDAAYVEWEAIKAAARVEIKATAGR